MSPFIRLFACAILAFHFAAPPPSRAADAPAPLPVIAMQHSSWSAADGAPTGVTGIAQTPDGWLWIGGSAGLFRFDGVRFERAPAALAPLSSNIANLGLLPDGSLWMTYQFGGASLMRDGKMRHFRVGEHGTPGGSSGAVGQDGAGRIWLGMSPGLRYLGADGNWQAPPPTLGAPNGDVTSMLLDRRGTFWVRTRDAVHMLRKDAARFERRLAVGGSGKLAEHPDGSVWTSDMMGGGLALVEGVAGTDPQAWRTEDRVNQFRFDRAGRMWMPGGSGITRLALGGSGGATPSASAVEAQRTGKANGLSGHNGFTVYEDSEDNVWVGTENGIDRFLPFRLHVLPLPPYIAGARPLAPRAGGGVWIDRSYVPRPDARLEQIEQFAPKATDADLTTALHTAPDGTLWSGGIGGLWRIRGGQREAVPLPAAVPDPQRTVIFSLDSGADGALWVSMGRRGVYTLRKGEWHAHGDVAGLAGFAPTVMVGDPGGRMWFGSTDDQLAVLERGVVRRAGRAEGLAMGTVLSILPVGAGAWIGGENGLAWYDGTRFIQVGGREGEAFAGTTGLVFAADGTLWLNGGAGISSIAPGELQAAMRQPGYRVRYTRLDYRDGLPGTASGITPLPSAIRSEDGSLWFSTKAGTVGFDPRTLPRNGRVPPVVITALKADGKAYPAQDGLRLAPDTGTLEIAFSALSYRAPERMRFRYRLEGVDTGWQEPEGRRSAYYTRLPPGSYRFRVAASNDDGLWNEQGAVLAFELAPSLTQTLWFRVLCALAFAAGLWLLHRMRLRRVARQVRAKMDARLAERERIARELHDTLLQSVQGLLLKMGAAVHRLRAEERPPLEAALEDAYTVLGEGRDRVAGLRGESMPAMDLATEIAAYAAPLARERGVRFDVALDGEPVPLARPVAEEAFAISREAVWNAFAHAQPTAVTVTLAYRPKELTVTIADDGRGMAPALLQQGGRAGHWGIPGMRERAAGIGALDVASQPGAGTTWRLRVPLARKPEAGRERQTDAA